MAMNFGSLPRLATPGHVSRGVKLEFASRVPRFVFSITCKLGAVNTVVSM
jgi:hypothetical protein